MPGRQLGPHLGRGRPQWTPIREEIDARDSFSIEQLVLAMRE